MLEGGLFGSFPLCLGFFFLLFFFAIRPLGGSRVGIMDGGAACKSFSTSSKHLGGGANVHACFLGGIIIAVSVISASVMSFTASSSVYSWVMGM